MFRTLSRVPGLLLLLLTALSSGALGQARDRYFMTSDGVRLHYLESGPESAHTIVFVPGWTMPAWIWAPQIEAFSRHFHVIAFDPRGQGESAIPAEGYEPVRRGRDIGELIARQGPQQVVVVAWSLGVLDTLAAIHVQGDRQMAGLVLVDNSVGEEPAPTYHPPRRHTGPPVSRDQFMHQFVRTMFAQPQPAPYLERLTESCLRTPEYASRALLAYPVPRSYWKEAVYATKVPVLYIVRPKWMEQANNLVRNRPDTEIDVFTDAGHALFVDEPSRFNRLTESFLRRRVWQ
jgi:microsomal epoxide hydrolase